MKHSLLLLGVVAALAIGAPAYSQYIFMDVNVGVPAPRRPRSEQRYGCRRVSRHGPQRKRSTATA